MWQAVGRSCIGSSHQKASIPCQDAHTIVVSGNRTVIAIADGAGSARYAERGSRLVANALVAAASCYTNALSGIDAELSSTWLGAARRALAAEAELSASPISDYASTLLFAVLEGDEGYFWQLGDGAWIVNTPAGIEVATWPYIGQYVNETVFVTSDPAEEVWTHAYFPNVSEFIGLTDGLEHLCLDFRTKRAHVPFVAKVFSSLKTSPVSGEVERQIEALLTSDMVNERTDDDKTMVIGWKHGASDVR